MRKRVRYLSEEFEPVTLFLDDVEKIVDAILEVSPEVELVTENYVLTNVNQLSQLREPYLKELEIRSSNPYLVLALRRSSAELRGNEDSPACRGTFEKIRSLVLSRRRVLARLAFGWFYWLVAGIASLAILLGLVIAFWKSSWIAGAAVLAGIATYCTWVWWQYHVTVNEHSLIVLCRSSEHQSFWQRNRDSILVGVLIAVFGALTAWVVNAITRR